MPLRPQDVAEMVLEQISLPEVCVRINEMVESPDYSMRDIAKIIAQDPVLSATVLRLANSPYYGFASRVETVSRAVMLIGTQELRDLVLATSAVESFSRIPNDLVDLRCFWRHSLYSGIVSRILAVKCDLAHKERMFVIGLLHDIGKLAMYGAIPELVEVIFARYRVWTGPLYEAEQSILKFHHGDVGSELMKLWHLPESFADVLLHHHEPSNSAKHAKEAAILHVANYIAHLAGFADTHMEDEGEFEPGAWQALGLDESIIEGVIQAANAQYDSIVATFLAEVRPSSAA